MPCLFQPTLPARGATAFGVCSVSVCEYFNPRSPHGERPPAASLPRLLVDFNPRSPHGERHAFSPPDFDPLIISTHAPRTGSDFSW